MLSVTRERVLERLLALKAVTDLYAVRDPAFASSAVDWLEGTARSLGALRHPLASLAAAEKGRVLAAADGLRDAEIRSEKTTARQAERAGAAAALARVEAHLREALDRAQATLAGYEEQMANLVAYSASKQPIPERGDRPRELWLRDVWKGLVVNGDGRANQTQLFLAARLPWVDRLYVLGDVLDKLLDEPR